MAGERLGVSLSEWRHQSMAVSVFVGNVSFQVREDDLRDFFESSGVGVSKVRIPLDDQKRSRGFAFVELENELMLDAACRLSGKELNGRELRIDKSNPRPERAGGGRRRG